MQLAGRSGITWNATKVLQGCCVLSDFYCIPLFCLLILVCLLVGLKARLFRQDCDMGWARANRKLSSKGQDPIDATSICRPSAAITRTGGSERENSSFRVVDRSFEFSQFKNDAIEPGLYFWIPLRLREVVVAVAILGLAVLKLKMELIHRNNVPLLHCAQCDVRNACPQNIPPLWAFVLCEL